MKVSADPAIGFACTCQSRIWPCHRVHDGRRFSLWSQYGVSEYRPLCMSTLDQGPRLPSKPAPTPPIGWLIALHHRISTWTQRLPAVDSNLASSPRKSAVIALRQFFVHIFSVCCRPKLWVIKQIEQKKLLTSEKQRSSF